MDNSIEIKVVVVGDLGSGKTALINRYSENKFFGTSSTIVAGIINIIKPKLKNIKFLIWDCSGNEFYKETIPCYYTHAHAAIICVDLTNKASLNTLDRWIEDIRSRSNKIPILLVGTKDDLSSENKITEAELKQKAIAKNCKGYFITSAKNENCPDINSLFNEIIQLNKPYIDDISCQKEFERKQNSIWHQHKRKIITGFIIGAFMVAAITLSIILPVTVPFLFSIGLTIPFTGPAAMAALAGIGAALGLIAGSVVAGITFGIEAIMRRFHRIEKTNTQSEVEKDNLTKSTKPTSVGKIAQALGSSSSNLLSENNKVKELTSCNSKNPISMTYRKTVHNPYGAKISEVTNCPSNSKP